MNTDKFKSILAIGETSSVEFKRNLYKYCRSYGGGDPVFTEGNDFVISVPLHKLDSVRFSFEKPSIASGKPSIATDKPSIRQRFRAFDEEDSNHAH